MKREAARVKSDGGTLIRVSSLSPFVGRENELETARRLLGEAAPLIVLKGPPGAGKTRLLSVLADESTAALRLVDVSEVRDEAALWAVLADALDVKDDAEETVATAWRALETPVLLLDNFEQAVDACAEALARVIGPDARAVITSRTRLGLSHEHVIELGQLPTDAALSLWQARVRAHTASYAHADDPHAVDIVTRLEGMPLALELAARRMRVLGSSQLLARLDRSMELLRKGPKDAPARQRTLRAALDESWELLSPPARAALAQCSIFRRGFTFEAAEAVLALEDADLLETLEELVDASLVQRAEGPRLQLLGVVRDYAESHLPEPRRPALRRRYATYYATFARDRYAEMAKKYADSTARALFVELFNLRQVIRLEETTAQQRVWALMTLRYVGPFSREALEGIDAELARRDPEMPSAERARMLLTRAAAYRRSCAHRDAERLTAEGLAIIEANEELAGLLPGATLHQAYTVGRQAAKADQALQLYERGQQLAFAAGSTVHECIAHYGRGMVQLARGELGEAQDAFEEGVALAREHDEPSWAAMHRAALALVLAHQGDIDDAERTAKLAREDVPTLVRYGDETIADLALTLVALERGAIEQAEQHIADGLSRLAGTRSEIDNERIAELHTVAALARLDEPEVAVKSARQALALVPRESPLQPLVAGTAARFGVAGAVPAETRFAPMSALVELLGLAPGESASEETLRHAERHVLGRRLLSRLGGPAPTSSFELTVRADGTWFSLAGEQRVDLGPSPVLARLLGILVDRAKAGAGPISSEALVADLWPDERFVKRSGHQRVRANIARLRKLGLREFLRSGPSGYSLDLEDAHLIEGSSERR